MKQKTIAQKFEIEGIGLHTGKTARLTCLPAPANKGIVFKRTDLEDQPEIPAIVNFVDSTFRSTCLKKGEAQVHTTEHLMSAFYGLGIDNVIIEIDGPEVPILDGSSQIIATKITASGVTELEEDREYIEFDEILTFTDPESGADYVYMPVADHDRSEITAIIDYHNSKIGRQVATYRENISYEDEIASARTFVFVNELEALAKKGVIKGGSLDNAIVFGHKDFPKEKVAALASQFNVEADVLVDNGILNGLTLRYPNEPARHKLLDLLGDLYLLKNPIKGKIIATKPGHTGNVAFAKFIKGQYTKKKKLKGKPRYVAGQVPIKTIEEIKTYIPHRYPFLLVDSILELSENHVVGLKNVTGNEQFFEGHFPGNPVFPGVLQMEALAQAGGILALSTVDDPSNYNTYFLKLDKVRFKKLVVPGDTMILKLELITPIRRGIFHMQGTVYVGDAIVSEGELTAQISKRS